MFPFHTEEYLRSLEADRERDLRGRRLLRELREARSGMREAPRPAAAPVPAPYAGPERRQVPCPEVAEAMTT